MGAVCSKHGLAAAGWAEVEQVAWARWQVAWPLPMVPPRSAPPELASPPRPQLHSGQSKFLNRDRSAALNIRFLFTQTQLLGCSIMPTQFVARRKQKKRNQAS
jgi:hypothetical protein